MKILISGGNGGFAKEMLRNNSEHEILAPSKKEMNITVKVSILKNIFNFKPDVFIHAAAMTTPMTNHVDRPKDSINTNIIGTCNVVKECLSAEKFLKKYLKLIYISTDYVYPGINGNYSEEDGVLPVNNYAWTKLGGECAVKLYPNHLILRCCMTPYPFSHKNAVVDSYKSCLYHSDAAAITLDLLKKDLNGVINVGGERKSTYEFAVEDNKNIGKISLCEIKEQLAKDSSMNIKKMKGILDG